MIEGLGIKAIEASLFNLFHDMYTVFDYRIADIWPVDRSRS